ncbi:major facilitator superfamily domain-containing protein [Paraphoma chrysanthemicola]|uniref:Major facilitator superfamily domain-containing protein n=1 Tax=Paraphoma chrysanthemicola TaxID=798071 RepID=A0A8K0VRC8_9PLEO|nr:major facilitator superfamily domain-containing protein [Paraphoma chrysanthemicola]
MTTQTQLQQPIELESFPASPAPSYRTTSRLDPSYSESNAQFEHPGNDDVHPPSQEPAFSTTVVPDGGYGWVVVFCASVTTFWVNAMISCWGVLQVALLSSTLSNAPTSTVSFIGSLNLACGVAFGLFTTRLARWCGSRTTTIIGITLMSLGQIVASFSTASIAGLFVSIGVVSGIGINLVYTICNGLPVEYFSSKIGLANGLVKLGGGIGGTVMAIVLQALVDRVGIAWTFRIQGLLTLATGLPAAWFMIDRTRVRNAPFIELSMFRNWAFTAVFLAGAIGTFSLFVPPYYLPLFAQSLGLSSSTGAGLVAAFNACNAMGRFFGGPLCDKIGPTNTLLITMAMNAISMLAIWPVSSTLGPLVTFAILNGVANGSFFTVLPTVVASIFGPGRAVGAMSMSTTGWTIGYLMGAPIAGYLLQAAGGSENKQQDISAFRPAIFYAGGVGSTASLLVLLARLNMSKKISKRV